MDRRDSLDLLEQLIPEAQREPSSLSGLAEVCEDIPLALRIAGNRIASRPTWRAADYLYRLRSAENRLRLLVAGDLAVETAFSFSYDNLEPATARLFRAVSIIEGGPFDARLAAAIEGQDMSDTESRLEDLTDLGLLEARILSARSRISGEYFLFIVFHPYLKNGTKVRPIQFDVAR